MLAVRKVKGRPLFVADNIHIHHQLLYLGFKHYEVVGLLYLIQAVFIVLAWHYRYAADFTVIGVYSAFCLGFVGFMGGIRFSGWQAQ